MRSLLLTVVAFIFLIGLMMVYNTSSAEILDRSLDQSHHVALLRQGLYAITGILGAVLISRCGYDTILRLSFPLLTLLTLCLILVFVPGIGTARNGAHRWIGLGNLTFQPSELVKYLIPLTYIDYILKQKEITLRVFLKIGAILGVPIFLTMIEPDNGAAAVCCLNLLPLFFITKVRFKYWALPVLVLTIVMGSIALSLPYVQGRLQVYLHPELDIKGKGHQPHQAKIAAGSGKLFGRGAGASLQKFTYLPEAQNDYIAAIFAEEFGFVGICLLIILYMLFATFGFSIAMNAVDNAGLYIAMTITFLISAQAFLNLGVASALLPSKGVNLPFFSQGGTSLVANIMGLSLLLSVAKKSETKELVA